MRVSGSIESRPGSIPFVVLRGDHDLVTERELQATLQRALAGGSSVMVSLERVTHLGSPAIGALVAAHMQAERAGLLLALVVPAGGHSARRALDATGMLGSLTVFESARDAQRVCEAWGPAAPPAVAALV
jgi:anti-anti-sigma factor